MTVQSKIRTGVFRLLIPVFFLSPALADPPSVEGSIPVQDRSIASPDELAPPRVVPIEESYPTVTPEGEETLRLDLSSAMGHVLEEMPSLDKIASRIRQAEYRVQAAYTPAYPTVSFQAQYSRMEPSVSLPGGPVINPPDNHQFGLVIRQAISTFGRMKWNTLASKLAKRVVEEEYRQEINRLVQFVAQHYIEALLAQEQVLIAQDDLEAQLANLRTSRLLFEQGAAARFDVLRNSAAASRAQQVLIEARTNEELAKARLLSLLNQPLDRPLYLEALPVKAPNEGLVLDQAKLDALETRPDLRSLRWAVEQAKAQVKVAQTSNNPMLEFQNTLTHRNATGFNPGTQNVAAIVLSVPIYDGGEAHWQKEQAVEQVHQLVHDLELAERGAILEIEESYRRLRDRWRAIGVAQENVLQADEAMRVAVLRYENGISTNVELLETQAARSRARFDLAQARGNFLASSWNWWLATAGEYPTEVPLPINIRERLEAEGIPRRHEALSDEETGSELGPLLPEGEELAPLPIRGLPTPDAQDDESSPSDSLDIE